MIKPITTVKVRWHDGYLETFECKEVRMGANYIWMLLSTPDCVDEDRWIPTTLVRWVSLSPISRSKSNPNGPPPLN